MPLSVQLRLDGAKQLASSLYALQAAINQSVPVLALRIGREGETIVRKLTPRQRRRNRGSGSKRGFPPIHSQWQLIDRGVQQGLQTVVIHNRAADNPAGLAILASLEAGASPHAIVGNPYLAWEQPQAVSLFAGRQFGVPGPADVSDAFNRVRRRRGRVILGSPTRPGVVNHPGHEAFRMVAETRDQLDRITRIYLAQMQAQIGRIMSVTVR